MDHPLRLRCAVVIALGSCALLGAGRAAAGSLDAGASTFESAAHRYAPAPIRDEDIRVPNVRRASEAPAVTLPEGPAFRIDRFEVTGNTLLDTTEVEQVLEPFRGEGRSLADVEKARDALQKRYEADGFLTVAVAIPQQTIESGAVRLEVVEARIGAVTVRNEGIHWVSDRRVLGQMRNTVPGAVLRREDLEADLMRANHGRDVRVRVEQPSGAAPTGALSPKAALRQPRPESTITVGTPSNPVKPFGDEQRDEQRDVLEGVGRLGGPDMAVVVDDRIPLHGNLAVDNDHTWGTSKWRTDASVSYTNLWGLGHEISGFYEFVPSWNHTAPWQPSFEDVQSWVGSYRMPMPWDEGQSLFAYYSKSDTTSRTPLPDVFVLGKSVITGGRYTVALPTPLKWKGVSHELSMGADYKHIENAFRVVDFPSKVVTPPITYMPFTVAWSGTRVGDQAIHDGRIGLSFNFAGMVEGGSEDDFQLVRGGINPDSDVTGDYQIVSLSLGQILRVPAILTTLAAGRFVDLPVPARSFADDWTFDVRASGQIASQPLVPTEQIGIGGADTARGYLSRERVGDNGYVLHLELHTPEYRNFLGGRLDERVQATLFWDDAEVWLYGDPQSPSMHSRLASYGVALRAALFDTLSLELSLAEPLIETGPLFTAAGGPQAAATTLGSSTGPRLQFHVTLGF